MKIKTLGKILLGGLITLAFVACSDSKESLQKEMKDLEAKCGKEAVELKANKDQEGFTALFKECTEKGNDLKQRFEALED